MDTKELVAAAKKKAGGTQQQLADAIGASRESVSRWGRGLEPGPSWYGALLRYVGKSQREVNRLVTERVMNQKEGR